MRTAGVILDIYDDPKAQILRAKLAGKALPEKLASSELLDHGDLATLPDRLFALVATNSGDVVRKYAMHDAPHLMTSIIYFMECGHVLPEGVQTKVASNLVNACAWYEVDPPEGLVKKAFGKALAGLGAATATGLGALGAVQKAKEGSAQKQQQMEDFRRAQSAGSSFGKVASGTVVELTADEDRKLQRGEDMPSHVTKVLARTEKKADLTGTEIMPQGALRSTPVRPSPNKRMAMPAKTSAAQVAAEALEERWMHAGDLTNEEAPVEQKRASYGHFALPHLELYPIDTPELVKRATDYFDDHMTEFSLPDRRIFAQSVHLRSHELGVKVAGEILAYAGDTYGPYVAAELLARENSFIGTGHETVYSVLREKVSEIDPMVMVEMLKEADEATGASRSYGRPGTGFRDPYAAVYGSEKVAAEKKEDTYSWTQDGTYVSGIQLEALAQNANMLKGVFEDDMIKSFKTDPVGIFKSLPDTSKLVLARLASDNSGGTTFRV